VTRKNHNGVLQKAKGNDEKGGCAKKKKKGELKDGGGKALGQNSKIWRQKKKKKGHTGRVQRKKKGDAKERKKKSGTPENIGEVKPRKLSPGHFFLWGGGRRGTRTSVQGRDVKKKEVLLAGWDRREGN